MSKSVTITELKSAGLPTHRRPTTPGEVIKTEFLEPMQLTQTQLAEEMGIPLQRLNMIIKGKRGVTPDTALRLSKALGCSIKFWLNLQQSVDLYDAITGPASSNIGRISRVKPRAGMVKRISEQSTEGPSREALDRANAIAKRHAKPFRLSAEEEQRVTTGVLLSMGREPLPSLSDEMRRAVAAAEEMAKKPLHFTEEDRRDIKKGVRAAMGRDADD